jgi:zeaxanthin epoxidase
MLLRLRMVISPVLLPVSDEISAANPLNVLIAGAGVGGLTAKVLSGMHKVTILEQTSEFKRFGGPIQLASNALAAQEMDEPCLIKLSRNYHYRRQENGIKMVFARNGT